MSDTNLSRCNFAHNEYRMNCPWSQRVLWSCRPTSACAVILLVVLWTDAGPYHEDGQDWIWQVMRRFGQQSFNPRGKINTTSLLWGPAPLRRQPVCPCLTARQTGHLKFPPNTKNRVLFFLCTISTGKQQVNNAGHEDGVQIFRSGLIEKSNYFSARIDWKIK
jgi:hypothetical protein